MQYGDLDSGLVMRDKTGQSRGFGFVTFRSREAAEAVLNSKNLELDGRRVGVESYKCCHCFDSKEANTSCG